MLGHVKLDTLVRFPTEISNACGDELFKRTQFCRLWKQIQNSL